MALFGYPAAPCTVRFSGSISMCANSAEGRAACPASAFHGRAKEHRWVSNEHRDLHRKMLGVEEKALPWGQSERKRWGGAGGACGRCGAGGALRGRGEAAAKMAPAEAGPWLWLGAGPAGPVAAARARGGGDGVRVPGRAVRAERRPGGAGRRVRAAAGVRRRLPAPRRHGRVTPGGRAGRGRAGPRVTLCVRPQGTSCPTSPSGTRWSRACGAAWARSPSSVSGRGAPRGPARLRRRPDGAAAPQTCT